MDERYARNLGALTEEECLRLRGKKILIAGCGGLGGYIIDMLLRLGVGTIVVADGDVFEASNLNRQLLSEPALLGGSKAEAAARWAARVNSDVEFTAIKAYIDEDNVYETIQGCDAVMDALDGISSRKLLANACSKAGIPFIHGAICGWVAQAGISLPGDGLIDALYPAGASISDKSSLAMTPALCAAMQVALCIKLLTGRPVETGKLYYFDMLNMEFEQVF